MAEKRWCQNCSEEIVEQRLGWVHVSDGEAQCALWARP